MRLNKLRPHLYCCEPRDRHDDPKVAPSASDSQPFENLRKRQPRHPRLRRTMTRWWVARSAPPVANSSVCPARTAT